MSRLIVVSNRLPFCVEMGKKGPVFSHSTGGLVTGLKSLSASRELLWLGWPGVVNEQLTEAHRREIHERLRQDHCYPVFLSEEQVKNYYHGFSNKTIWPLFHYFPLYTAYDVRFWKAYEDVNQIFCDAVTQIATAGDYLWIHDYQLMLLPHLLRERLRDIQIGFFLHIPFPSFELFRLLPWREEILRGMLGSDVVGFHTYDYARHFLSSVSRILGAEHSLGKIAVDNRLMKVDVFPMGIDYEKYSQAPHAPEVRQEIQRIRQRIGERQIILSLDRLDYTKGILHRLEAFDLFLSQNRQYIGKVTLILLAVPSRANIDRYKSLRVELEALVGRINGEHGTLGRIPVWYLYRTVPIERLIALYSVADVGLVTPLRDGMNLVAKEFLATHTDKKGVLILSDTAGAASELGEAIVVNANDKGQIVQALKEALEMPPEEQIRRNELMQKRLSRYTVFRWAEDFLAAMQAIEKLKEDFSTRLLDGGTRKHLIQKYQQATKRLLLLDYDGTLRDFVARPEQAAPDSELLELLGGLAADARNTVVIVSGRDRDTLQTWLANLNVALVAEHGAWSKQPTGPWHQAASLHADWKIEILPILELFADRTAGSFVEEKNFSLVWHYRRADPELASVRIHELRQTIEELAARLDVGVFEGHKIFEVRSLAVNKGRSAELWLHEKLWQFVLALGDDYTDEDMFSVMPKGAYSIRIGSGVTKARFHIGSVAEARSLLRGLIRS